ncbi:MAG TPA: hypothetical protein VMF61_10155, partial [Candidatus Acidoferrales bacterium]|nr:hypothetical protein [Candidatus Acidoferrales bacterium]
DIAFDRRGRVYVGNQPDWSAAFQPLPGTVAVFGPGAHPYLGQLADSSFTGTLYGIGVDARDNCYVTHQTTNGSELAIFPGCSTTATAQLVPWTLRVPGKPQFDAAGELLVTDSSDSLAPVLDRFTVLPGGYGQYGYYPPSLHLRQAYPLFGSATECPLDRAQTRFYCTDSTFGGVDVYSYPAGTYLFSFNQGMADGYPIGIAVSPAARN